MRKIACLCATSLLLATCSVARVHTTKIGGTISAPDGKPAVDVQVMVERSDGSLPLATHTDSHGHFLFKFVPPGLYDIRASDATAASVWKQLDRSFTERDGSESSARAHKASSKNRPGTLELGHDALWAQSTNGKSGDLP